ncbi:MAG: hypothetical protein CMJ08_04180 [Pelagibacterales bacterium]|nr:hypothetical protein [Pelagibacterales bacterium]
MDILFLLFSLLILLLLIFPLYRYGNSATPLILGLPFSLFWIISCITFQFIGIVIFLINDKDN